MVTAVAQSVPLEARIRALLYAGRPNWDLLATVTPR